MNRRYALATIALAVAPLVAVAACAASGEDASPVDRGDGGPPEASDLDVTEAGRGDSEAIRCSREFCIVDLPNPALYGFSKWIFDGVEADPIIGTWAIANGVAGVDDATAQLLHFEGGVWKPVYAPALGEGVGRRSVRLYSLAADGAGHLVAVGATLDDDTGVVVRGDGTTFTTTAFDGKLWAVWYASEGQAWAAGGGTIHRPAADGGWISEEHDAGREAGPANFVSIWGSGPEDVYIAGNVPDRFGAAIGYVGHYEADGAGARWSFLSMEKLDLESGFSGENTIIAGVATRGGEHFWSADSVFARRVTTEKTEGWEADSQQPRATVRGFWARQKDDIWAVGDFGRVLHFDGSEWRDLLLVFNGAPMMANLMDVAGTSSGEIVVVGDGTALWRAAK